RIAPATATYDAGGTRQGAVWIFLRTSFVIISVIPVFTPFPNVAGHVVQTEAVWPPGTNRMGLFAAVVLKPGIIAKFIQVACASPQFLFAAATRRIFPLCLVRKSVVLSGQIVQSPDEFLGIFPQYVFHRAIAATLFKARWI